MITSKSITELLKDVKVEWKSLGNSLIRTKGTKLTASQMKELHKEGAPIKIFAGGKTIAFVDKNDIPEKNINTEPSIIVKSRGIIEFEFYNQPFSHKSELWSYHSKNKNINIKYVYYYLKNEENYFRNISKKMQMPQISIPDTDDFLFPIPPIHIQNEIVKILDTFTTMTAELTAELNIRKQQYNYYRDKLLTFKDSEVEWGKIDDIFVLKNGYTPSKAISQYWNNPDIPWFRMEDIRENGKILSNALQKVNKIALKGGKIFPANSIIIATSATIGEHALITVPYLSNQRFTNLSLKEEYQELFDIKFVFYYCFMLCDWCKNNTTISNFASVDMNGFKKFKFPIPPLSEQKRIVEILDKFDSLTNSITEGLPREIELRQKQYEYYRNLLLDFPRVNE